MLKRIMRPNKILGLGEGKRVEPVGLRDPTRHEGRGLGASDLTDDRCILDIDLAVKVIACAGIKNGAARQLFPGKHMIYRTGNGDLHLFTGADRAVGVIATRRIGVRGRVDRLSGGRCGRRIGTDVIRRDRDAEEFGRKDVRHIVVKDLIVVQRRKIDFQDLCKELLIPNNHKAFRAIPSMVAVIVVLLGDQLGEIGFKVGDLFGDRLTRKPRGSLQVGVTVGCVRTIEVVGELGGKSHGLLLRSGTCFFRTDEGVIGRLIVDIFRDGQPSDNHAIELREGSLTVKRPFRHVVIYRNRYDSETIDPDRLLGGCGGTMQSQEVGSLRIRKPLSRLQGLGCGINLCITIETAVNAGAGYQSLYLCDVLSERSDAEDHIE